MKKKHGHLNALEDYIAANLLEEGTITATQLKDKSPEEMI